MTKQLNIFFLLLLVLTVGACDDSGSLLPPVRMDLVMAEVDEAGRLSVINVDEGPSLNVVKVKHSSLLAGPNVPTRAIAYYVSDLDLNEAVIYDIANVSVVTPQLNNATNILQQYPAKFIRGWISPGFLNVEVGIKAKNIKLHVIGFDEQTSKLPNTVELMFIHNKGEDIDAATKSVLVSIPLANYDQRFLGEAYTINLKIRTSDSPLNGVEVKQFKTTTK